MEHYMGGGQNLKRWNVEQSIFRNFKIANIKIMKDSFDSFIIEFTCLIFFKLCEQRKHSIILSIVKYWFSKR